MGDGGTNPACSVSCVVQGGEAECLFSARGCNIHHNEKTGEK